MRRDSEEEEEVAAPAPKAPKIMGDAIRSGLQHLSPRKHPKLPPRPSLHQRGIPGVFQLLRRTRPQCPMLLKMRMKKDRS